MSRRVGSWASTLAAWVLSLAVHLLLALALFWAVEWQQVPPAPFSVDLVAPIALSTERAPSPEPGAGAPPEPGPLPPKPEPKPEPPPAPKPEPKPLPRPEPRPAPEPPNSPPSQPEVAVKAPSRPELKPKPPAPKQPEPKKLEPKPEPPQPEPKPKQKKPEPAKSEPKPEPKRPEPMVKEEDFVRLAQERLRQQQAPAPARDSVAERLQALAERRSAGAPSGPSDAARASYIDAVRAKIRTHIVVPPGISGNPEAVFDVTQLPDGSVVDVRLVRSSGVGVLDQALERAIRAASPLPTPPNPRLFERQLRLILRPLAQ